MKCEKTSGHCLGAVRLASIDVGFDLRVQAAPVQLPTDPKTVARMADESGEYDQTGVGYDGEDGRYIVWGTHEEVTRVLTEAGYTIKTTDPTPADYEKLARTLSLAQGNDPDAMTEITGGECPEWELHAIGAGNTCVSTTRDTLDDFRQASKDWREPGKCEEVNGGLYWAECQAAKGQQRCELCVVDCGEFRLVFQC